MVFIEDMEAPEMTGMLPGDGASMPIPHQASSEVAAMPHHVFVKSKRRAACGGSAIALEHKMNISAVHAQSHAGSLTQRAP
jgi:hypothetical protein